MDEKLEKAKRFLEDFLISQDSAGLKYPTASAPWHTGPIYVPILMPHENGTIDPFYYYEDFVDGKIPDNMRWVPGYELPGQDFMLHGESAIHFLTPELNLPPLQAQMLAAAQMLSANPMLGRQAFDEFIGTSKDESEIISSDSPVMEYSGVLCLKANGGRHQLTNFTVTVAELRTIHIRGQSDYTEVSLLICCEHERREIILRTAGIDRVCDVITAQFPQCTISTEIRNAKRYVVNYVRSKLPGSPRAEIYQRTGFEEIGGNWVYIHDAATPPNRQIRFETGLSIAHRPLTSAAAAAHDALKFLNLTQDLSTILPLFLLIHLGPMARLFAAADCPIRFVSFFLGPSGSFKTTLGLCAATLFAEQPKAPAASFNDTIGALREKLSNAHGRVLLVDDFRPPRSAAERARLNVALEELIRLVGDSNARDKLSASSKIVSSGPPQGTLLVTGEIISGSESSLLRCLTMTVKKGEVSSEVLAEFTRDPLILSTHLYHFLQWAGNHGAEIIDIIKSNAESFRELFARCSNEPRHRDIGVTLYTAGLLLLWYLLDAGAITSIERDRLSEVWFSAIKTAVHRSESISSELSPAALFLQALFTLLANGDIMIAPSPAQFEAKQHLGFCKSGDLWLLPDKAFHVCTTFLSARGQTFPVPPARLYELLADLELIEISHENQSGAPKVLYSKRSSVSGRPRMLVLHEANARAYLDAQGIHL